MRSLPVKPKQNIKTKDRAITKQLEISTSTI